MLSKKDYIAIAGIINRIEFSGLPENDKYPELISQLIGYMELDNPKFSWDMFVKAAFSVSS